MRIPPAIAKEIGAMYAAAQVNEAAARTLTKATMNIDVARTAVVSGDRTQAVADAERAVELLLDVIASTDARIARDASKLASAAGAQIGTGISAVQRGDITQALALLAGASADAAAAAKLAEREGALQRHSADQLAADWMRL